MGKLVSTIFVTLDGVYQAPGGPQEDTTGGFAHGGWSFRYGDDDFGRFVTEVFDRAGAFLLGRRTYEIFASYWPRMTDPDDPIASRLNGLPKYVVSSTLDNPGWTGTTVVGGDLAKEVAALKERTDGELQIHGSGAWCAPWSTSGSSTPCTCSPSVVLGTGAGCSWRAPSPPPSATPAAGSPRRASPSSRTTSRAAGVRLLRTARGRVAGRPRRRSSPRELPAFHGKFNCFVIDLPCSTRVIMAS